MTHAASDAGDNAPKNPFANMFSKSGAPPPPPGGGGGGSGGGGFGQPGGDVPQGPEQPLLQVRQLTCSYYSALSLCCTVDCCQRTMPVKQLMLYA